MTTTHRDPDRPTLRLRQGLPGLRNLVLFVFAGLHLWSLSAFSRASPASTLSPDFGGKEPSFPPGSLFWHTNEYRTCPIVYRTVIQIHPRPVASAVARLQYSQHAFVFLNGHPIASSRSQARNANATPQPLDFDLLPHLQAGPNALVVSTRSDGFSLVGSIVYADKQVQPIASNPTSWRSQKLPPLTILEDQPFMKADFDDRNWFATKPTPLPPLQVSDSELRQLADQLARARSGSLDADAAWRLRMLTTKGFAIVDWQSHGFGGADRLPPWVLQLADSPANAEVGSRHLLAEAMSQYVVLSDRLTSLRHHSDALAVLNAPATSIEAARTASQSLDPLVTQMELSLRSRDFPAALAVANKARAIIDSTGPLSPLNVAQDNKFAWCDTTAFLESGPHLRDVAISPPAATYASPLSPATLITAKTHTITLTGWSTSFRNNVYNRKTPSNAPVSFWAVVNGKPTAIKPVGDTLYDSGGNAKLTENWLAIISDLSRGGDLPLQLVFLNHPSKIALKTTDKQTEITLAFPKPAAQVLALRPLKEWRGLLQMAQDLNAPQINDRSARAYLEQFRLFSRSLLHYPISFTESYIRDPNDKWAILVSDSYTYLDLKDEFNTTPLKLAPLPPLASYGLTTNYPGLKLISPAKTLGSLGIWGDYIAVSDSNHIEYRVPVDPIKRFAGFTSYCFGGTDIGQPGSKTEIASIKATGANSFRPQHNQTGEPALRTAQWCADAGIQNVFNTDEKWVSDVVGHYRTLAQKCANFPPDAIAYDLLNEPQTRDPHPYSVLIKKITNAIREYDKTHLIYVETMPPWGPGAKPFPQNAFETLEPTGDPLTVYSFHDYEYRLGQIESAKTENTPRAYWPNEHADIRSLYTRYIPALRFSIHHRAPIHLGEFGGFEQTTQNVYENPSAMTMILDYLALFDQYAWHYHYYANRGAIRARPDGSLEESYVQKAYRRNLARGLLNVNRQN